MQKVAIVVQDGVWPFGLGTMCEVWAEPEHPEDGTPVFDFVVVTPRPGRVRGPSGFDLHVEHGLDEAEDADLLILSPKEDFLVPSPEAAGRLTRPLAPDRRLHPSTAAKRGGSSTPACGRRASAR